MKRFQESIRNGHHFDQPKIFKFTNSSLKKALKGQENFAANAGEEMLIDEHNKIREEDHEEEAMVNLGAGASVAGADSTAQLPHTAKSAEN